MAQLLTCAPVTPLRICWFSHSLISVSESSPESTKTKFYAKTLFSPKIWSNVNGINQKIRFFASMGMREIEWGSILPSSFLYHENQQHTFLLHGIKFLASLFPFLGPIYGRHIDTFLVFVHIIVTFAHQTTFSIIWWFVFDWYKISCEFINSSLSDQKRSFNVSQYLVLVPFVVVF